MRPPHGPSNSPTWFIHSNDHPTVTAKKKSAKTPKKAEQWQNVDVAKLAQLDINQRLSDEEKVSLYTDVVRIRRFEGRSLRAYQQGKIGGFLHLYEGQEAVAVGTVSLLGSDDHVITAYRCHGHAIAVGMDTKSLMAELYGKHTGCSKGKGGSMHFF